MMQPKPSLLPSFPPSLLPSFPPSLPFWHSSALLLLLFFLLLLLHHPFPLVPFTHPPLLFSSSTSSSSSSPLLSILKPPSFPPSFFLHFKFPAALSGTAFLFFPTTDLLHYPSLPLSFLLSFSTLSPLLLRSSFPSLSFPLFQALLTSPSTHNWTPEKKECRKSFPTHSFLFLPPPMFHSLSLLFSSLLPFPIYSLS